MRIRGGGSGWFVLFLVTACSGNGESELRECGPNGECPSGYECEPTRRRCVVLGSLPRDAAVPDAPLVADAPVPDAPLPDAPLPDADLPDAFPPDAPLPDAPLPDASLPDAPSLPPDAAEPDAPGATTFIGPLPYLKRADSPFTGLTTFHLEDFEDHLINTPGLSASSNSLSSASGTSLIDSVDEDDGVLDGTCQAGCDALFGPGTITFTFDAAALGRLPTHAGVVWTDGGIGATVTLVAFGADGLSMGFRSGMGFQDGTFTGGTGEDRFFGVIAPAGILKIIIANNIGGIEADHVQYGW